MTISLLVPSRGRPERFAAMRHSAEVTAEGPIEFCVRLDRDDPRWHEYDLRDCLTLVGDRGVLSQAWNDAAELAAGDLLMLAADDLIFRTTGWDTAVGEAVPPDGIGLIYADDGFQHEQLATHPFLTRRWVSTVGTFVPPYFRAGHNDTWLHDVARRIDRAIYLPDVHIEHMHPTAGKSDMDATYAEQFVHTADCERIFMDTEVEREEWAERLRGEMW